MDQQLLQNARDRARQLDIDAQNLIGGSAGDDDGFRRRYLQWFEGMEDFFNWLRLPLDEITAMQSPRHRDIVNGVVPQQSLYRQVRAELDLGRRRLQDVVDRVLVNAAPATPSRSGQSNVVEFTSDDGRIYTYDPTDPLGPTGRHSAVFRGTDDTGGPVAVKRVILADPSPRRREDNARLAEREVSVGQALLPNAKHLLPHLATAHSGDDLLIVMPMAKRSLGDYIATSAPLPSDTVIVVVGEIAGGLVELAEGSIVHRDIKPPNVLQYRGRWCLADFGISRLLAEATATLTWTGSGTLEYRAPELWNGEPERVASDLYALGCIAYEMLTGAKLAPGPDFKEQHQTIVAALPNDTDPALAALIMDLLAKNPASRPTAALRVVDALRPRGPLTNGQRGLQAYRARRNISREEHAALDARTIRHRERLHASRAALAALWRRVADLVRDAIPAEVTEDRDGHPMIVIDGATFKIVTEGSAAAHQFDDLVLVGELMVGPAPSEQAVDGPRTVANLACRWNAEQTPEWLIVQLNPEEPPGTRTLAPSLLAAMWPTISAEPQHTSVLTREPATADLLLDLLVTGLDHD